MLPLCPCISCEGKPTPRNTYHKHQQQISSGLRALYYRGDEDESSAGDESDVNAELVLTEADDIDEEEDLDLNDLLFCIEIAEQVIRDRANESGMDVVLKIFRTRFANDLPAGKRVPSWYLVQKMVLQDYNPQPFDRHFCPVCDSLFPLDKAIDVCTGPEVDPRTGVPRANTNRQCGGQRYDVKGKAARVAVYFNLASRIQHWCSQKGSVLHSVLHVLAYINLVQLNGQIHVP